MLCEYVRRHHRNENVLEFIELILQKTTQYKSYRSKKQFIFNV